MRPPKVQMKIKAVKSRGVKVHLWWLGGGQSTKQFPRTSDINNCHTFKHFCVFVDHNKSKKGEIEWRLTCFLAFGLLYMQYMITSVGREQRRLTQKKKKNKNDTIRMIRLVICILVLYSRFSTCCISFPRIAIHTAINHLLLACLYSVLSLYYELCDGTLGWSSVKYSLRAQSFHRHGAELSELSTRFPNDRRRHLQVDSPWNIYQVIGVTAPVE